MLISKTEPNMKTCVVFFTFYFLLVILEIRAQHFRPETPVVYGKPEYGQLGCCRSSFPGEMPLFILRIKF